jgi:hypothetical protein
MDITRTSPIPPQIPHSLMADTSLAQPPQKRPVRILRGCVEKGMLNTGA